ncbi:MAG: ABC transporter ATP-binding protein [Alphaproteobacteria bacterium]|nr:ABC transporter ATP-binding protein [Alphaproteobacteria bacterium]
MTSLPRLLHRSRRPRLLGLVLCGLGQAAAVAAVALLVRRVFDGLRDQTFALSPQDIALILGGFAAAAAALLVLRVVERGVAEALGQSYVASLRVRLFRHTVDLPIRQLKARRRGHLMLRFVGDLNAVRLWVSHGFARIVIAAVTGPAAVGALLLINDRLALAAAAVFLVMTLAIVLAARPLTERHRQVRRRRAQLAGNLGEKLTEAPVVRAFGREEKEIRRLRRQSGRLLVASVSVAHASALVRNLPEAAGTVALALVIMLGFLEIQRGTATPGAVVATLTVLGLLTGPFRDLARVFDYHRAYSVARGKILTYLAQPTLQAPRKVGFDLPPGPGVVRFAGVSVEGAIRDLDAEAAPGAVTALVGANGAGKSTLLQLAMGLVQPDKGQVTIDGQDIAATAPSALSRAVGAVSPDLPLLRGTIDWNLRYRWPDAPAEEIDRVVELCGLAPMLASLPQSLETRLTEGGRNLSGGMRQRICLARALVGRPRLLLLDEADAELDRPGRAMLDRLLARGAYTVLLVTHDPARARAANEVWLLDGGDLVRQGPPVAVFNGESAPGQAEADASEQVVRLPGRAAELTS